MALKLRGRPWIACTLMLAIGIAANFEYLWRAPSLSKLLGAGDSHWYFGPQSAFMDWSIARGELPQWSPLNFCGQPFAANPQTGVFYPLNLLRSALTFEPTPLRTHVGLAILSAVHILIAGLGTFALARAQKLSAGASLVSAWGFAFSASMIRRVIGNQFLGVVSWLPLLLLALQKAMQARDPSTRTRAALLGGIALGVSVLGGFPQLSIYMGVGLVIHVLALRVCDVTPFGRRPRMTDIGLLVTLVVTAVLVAAPMLLPAAEFISHSTRVDPTVSLAADGAALTQYPGARQLLSALVIYPGSEDFALNYRACGAGIALLALLACLHPRRRSVTVWVMLFLAFLDCSLGPPAPLATLLSKLLPMPLISPSRGFFLACLPLALLAGFGVDAMGTASAERARRAVRTGWVIAAGALILAGLSAGSADPLFLGRGPAVLLLPAALIVTLVGCIWTRATWAPIILGLIVAETLTWNHAFVPHLIEERPFEGVAAPLHHPQSIPLDNRRFSTNSSNGLLYRLIPSVIGYDPLQLASARRTICSPATEREYSREITQLEATAQNQRGQLLLKRPFWLARQFARSALPGKDELYPVASTAFLETPASLQVREIEGADLPSTSLSPGAVSTKIPGVSELEWQVNRSGRRRRLTLPRFDVPAEHSALVLRYRSSEPVELFMTFVSPERSLPGYTRTLPASGAGSLDVELPLPDLGSLHARLSVDVSAPPPQLLEARLLSDDLDEDEHIRIQGWGANSVAVRVGPLEGARILTFVDAAYAGWTATVDGLEVPIYRAANAFKAIEVPAGNHDVVFTYSSRWMWIGLVVSGATLLLCGWRLCRPTVATGGLERWRDAH